MNEGRLREQNMDFSVNPLTAVEDESVEFSAMSLCFQGEMPNLLGGFSTSALLYLVSASVYAFQIFC